MENCGKRGNTKDNSPIDFRFYSCALYIHIKSFIYSFIFKDDKPVEHEDKDVVTNPVEPMRIEGKVRLVAYLLLLASLELNK